MKRRTMDIVLVIIAVVLVTFTIAMIITYWKMGGVPDILVTAVFGACLGEFGFMAWIKNVKERYGNERHDDSADSMLGNDCSGDGSIEEDAWRP